MPILPVVALAIAALVLAPSRQAVAADPARCLSPEQRRAAIVDRKALPLGRVMRGMRARAPGEVVAARLCESGGALVYMLTVLARDGKVSRPVLDAATGATIGGR